MICGSAANKVGDYNYNQREILVHDMQIDRRLKFLPSFASRWPAVCCCCFFWLLNFYRCRNHLCRYFARWSPMMYVMCYMFASFFIFLLHIVWAVRRVLCVPFLARYLFVYRIILLISSIWNLNLRWTVRREWKKIIIRAKDHEKKCCWC